MRFAPPPLHFLDWGGGGALPVPMLTGSIEITMLREAHWQYIQGLPSAGGGGLIDSIYRDYHAAGGLMDSIYRDNHAAGGSLTVSTEITMLRGAHWQYLQGLPCCGGLIDSIYRDYHAAGGGGLIDSIYRDNHAAGGSLTVSTEITMMRGAHWQYLQRLPCCGGGGGSLTVLPPHFLDWGRPAPPPPPPHFRRLWSWFLFSIRFLL